jgi:hypothetical protein
VSSGSWGAPRDIWIRTGSKVKLNLLRASIKFQLASSTASPTRAVTFIRSWLPGAPGREVDDRSRRDPAHPPSHDLRSRHARRRLQRTRRATRRQSGPGQDGSGHSSSASSADIPELNDTGNPVPNPRLPVLRACRRDLGTTWRWDRALEDQFKTIAFVVLFTDMGEARMPYERKRGLVGWTDRGTEYSRPGGCRPLPHTVGGLRC